MIKRGALNTTVYEVGVMGYVLSGRLRSISSTAWAPLPHLFCGILLFWFWIVLQPFFPRSRFLSSFPPFLFTHYRMLLIITRFLLRFEDLPRNTETEG